MAADRAGTMAADRAGTMAADRAASQKAPTDQVPNGQSQADLAALAQFEAQFADQFGGPAAGPAGASHANATLMLATAMLRQQDPGACELFASVARNHDVREAWLGLAIARHLNNEAELAGHALGRALSRHAVTLVPPLADDIAAALRAPGWCAVSGAGVLTVRLTKSLRRSVRLRASLDGEELPLSGRADGSRFTARLPATWRRSREIRVVAGEAALLGSPIMLARIARIEGFANSSNGDLHGWAWCPNDPDHDPVLSIVPSDGSPSITVVADDLGGEVDTRSALGRPRQFRVPANVLRNCNGPVGICGADGRNLTGSPLDPSAERRAAAGTARIFASLFPAPGQPGRAVGQELSFLAVPAHVMGGPVEGGFKRRAVDVVVPVHGGLEQTLACLASVLADLPRWAQVIVVDDASPDPRVVREIGELAAHHRITLLAQPVNQGFPRTANVGMRHDATRDVVLLNSDTLVPPGWLTSLREAAYSAPDIGSATPLSNAASILSYPSVEHDNAMPDLAETIQLDALAHLANAGCVVDVPTAVGFCAYVKRDCLNATGLLRDDIFAQGYGEENDFCIRARHLGWRHVAVPSVFVAHVGGHSFGAAKHHLMTRNMTMLNQLHPGYDSLIQEFQNTDPLAEPRRRLDLERWKTFRTRARSVLLVTHGRGGGVRRHVAERAAALRAQGLRPIVLWPVASRQGGGRDCVLGNGPEGGTPNLRFALPAELDLLVRILKADRPVRAEVHHMVGHDHQVMELFRRLDIPYDVVVHDYSWLCPRINLVGPDHRYCGEPDLAGCEACVADAGTTNDEATSPAALRARSAAELAGASNVVVPSTDVAARITRYFPDARPKVVNWEDDGLLPPAAPAALGADGVRRICVVGAIGIEKGYDVLLACARDVAARKLALRFHLVGHSCDDARLLATGCVQITGEYEEHEAVALIRQQRAQMAWLPSLWPETWCYTLTQAWQAGLNVLAFDIGTPAARIRRSGRGWLIPLGLAPRALNNRMAAPPHVDAGDGGAARSAPQVAVSRGDRARLLVPG
jgi:GT2 family glycosyltransferase/glycosyltransferase involved in cell wall biosynthesis